jgi:hypothetical protein
VIVVRVKIPLLVKTCTHVLDLPKYPVVPVVYTEVPPDPVVIKGIVGKFIMSNLSSKW